MPQNKTHSGAKKKFKVTGSGKLRRLKVGRKSGAAFSSEIRMITVLAAVICGVTFKVSAASLNVTVTVLLATV